MALELIVNLLLIAGGIFCFVNVSTTMPHSAVNELGAEIGRASCRERV